VHVDLTLLRKPLQEETPLTLPRRSEATEKISELCAIDKSGTNPNRNVVRPMQRSRVPKTISSFNAAGQRRLKPPYWLNLSCENSRDAPGISIQNTGNKISSLNYISKAAFSGCVPLDVRSRHLMDRIECETFRLICPLFADELIGRKASKGL